MEKKSKLDLLFCFLSENRTLIFLQVAAAAVNGILFLLCRLPVSVFIYFLVLCSVVILIVLALRFYRYVLKYNERLCAKENIVLLYNSLPSADTLAENDYCEMLEILGRYSEETVTTLRTRQEESVDYYSTWVHQIKTPISVMQMILQGEDTEEHRELLSELFRVEQYVDMALNYVRLDSDLSDFVIADYSIDSIIKKAIHKYAPQFVRKGIHLVYEPKNITVLTDEKWLLFIIEQIISNAIKYTFSGSVAIDVSSDRILRIADTGIGISAEDLPRIFDKGFTGYNGRSNSKSTGIGLYLSKKAAKKISAEITVESEVGKGSSFYINLQTVHLSVE